MPLTIRAVSVPLLLTLLASPALAQTPAPPQEPVNPTQEVAGEKPAGPAIVAGPTEIRIGGYLGLTGIYHSTASGGGPGTGYASIPYEDTLTGNVSEARLSAQPSRLSIRVNAAPAPNRSTLAGYFEMDFAGGVPGNVAVTSSSFEFRLRHAFGEAQFAGGRYLIVAGQAYSLMTPARNQLSIWPSDYELSNAVDLNYLAGTVWDRAPQVRFTFRPSAAFNWAVSAENPEQQIGAGVKLPACCTADLQAQYNTGGNGLAVPNLMPDIVSRVALNSEKALHLDVGGVMRVFRHTLKPYDDSFKQVGGGVSANARVRPIDAMSVIGQFSYGSGMGRYTGGLAPDVSISADGAIHLIPTTTWVAGVEYRISPPFSIALYDSGVRIDQRYSVDADGTYIGFGFPGSSNADNRAIDEVTGVFGWQPWSIDGRGSMQWNTQLSWLRRAPWSTGSGPSSASAVILLTQIRYNLP
jgi:hypothetical protein